MILQRFLDKMGGGQLAGREPESYGIYGVLPTLDTYTCTQQGIA